MKEINTTNQIFRGVIQYDPSISYSINIIAMTFKKLFFGFALLLLVTAETVKERQTVEQERNMAYRRLVTQQNIKIIETHNSNPSSTYKMYPYPAFVGLTHQELRHKHLNSAKTFYHNGKTYSTVLPPTTIARAKRGIMGARENIDLRSKVLTQIKNEGICIGGYATAVIDCVDMVNILLGRNVPRLSWQHLIDCSSGYGENKGCTGGMLMPSMDFIQYRGVYSERAYPIYSHHTGNEGNCRVLPSNTPRYRIRSYSFFTSLPGDANCDYRYRALEKNKPVAVGMTASSFDFFMYKSGILFDCGESAILDHHVVLVGAMLNLGDNSHWIIKNSWGGEWGEDGYARISSFGSACNICVDGIYTNG